MGQLAVSFLVLCIAGLSDVCTSEFVHRVEIENPQTGDWINYTAAYHWNGSLIHEESNVLEDYHAYLKDEQQKVHHRQKRALEVREEERKRRIKRINTSTLYKKLKDKKKSKTKKKKKGSYSDCVKAATLERDVTISIDCHCGTRSWNIEWYRFHRGDEKGEEATWYAKPVLAEDYGDPELNRIVVNRTTLTFKGFTGGDVGGYFCTRHGIMHEDDLAFIGPTERFSSGGALAAVWEKLGKSSGLGKIISLFFLDIKIVKTPKLVERNWKSMKPRPVDSVKDRLHNWEMMVEWAPWSQCDMCDVRGKKEREGTVYIKRWSEKMPTLPKYLNDILRLYPDGALVHSTLFEPLHPEIKESIDFQIEIIKCKIKCNDSYGEETYSMRKQLKNEVWEKSKTDIQKSFKFDSYIEVNYGDGGKNKTFHVQHLIHEIQEKKPIQLACPRPVFNRPLLQELHWENISDQDYLMTEIALEARVGNRITIRPNDLTLYFSQVKYADNATYACKHDEKTLIIHSLLVKPTLRVGNFMPSLLTLIGVNVLSFIVYVGLNTLKDMLTMPPSPEEIAKMKKQFKEKMKEKEAKDRKEKEIADAKLRVKEEKERAKIKVMEDKLRSQLDKKKQKDEEKKQKEEEKMQKEEEKKQKQEEMKQKQEEERKRLKEGGTIAKKEADTEKNVGEDGEPSPKSQDESEISEDVEANGDVVNATEEEPTVSIIDETAQKSESKTPKVKGLISRFPSKEDQKSYSQKAETSEVSEPGTSPDTEKKQESGVVLIPTISQGETILTETEPTSENESNAEEHSTETEEFETSEATGMETEDEPEVSTVSEDEDDGQEGFSDEELQPSGVLETLQGEESSSQDEESVDTEEEELKSSEDEASKGEETSQGEEPETSQDEKATSQDEEGKELEFGGGLKMGKIKPMKGFMKPQLKLGSIKKPSGLGLRKGKKEEDDKKKEDKKEKSTQFSKGFGKGKSPLQTPNTAKMQSPNVAKMQSLDAAEMGRRKFGVMSSVTQGRPSMIGSKKPASGLGGPKSPMKPLQSPNTAKMGQRKFGVSSSATNSVAQGRPAMLVASKKPGSVSGLRSPMKQLQETSQEEEPGKETETSQDEEEGKGTETSQDEEQGEGSTEPDSSTDDELVPSENSGEEQDEEPEEEDKSQDEEQSKGVEQDGEAEESGGGMSLQGVKFGGGLKMGKMKPMKGSAKSQMKLGGMQQPSLSKGKERGDKDKNTRFGKGFGNEKSPLQSTNAKKGQRKFSTASSDAWAETAMIGTKKRGTASGLSEPRSPLTQQQHIPEIMKKSPSAPPEEVGHVGEEWFGPRRTLSPILIKPGSPRSPESKRHSVTFAEGETSSKPGRSVPGSPATRPASPKSKTAPTPAAKKATPQSKSPKTTN